MFGDKLNRTLPSLIAGFVLLAVIISAAILLVVRQQQAAAMVLHTQEVENRLATVLSHLQDAETGQRGYLLTGRDPFLQPYLSAQRGLPNELLGLRKAVADNPEQARRADALIALAMDRFRRLTNRIEEFRATGTVEPEQLVVGMKMMNRFRKAVSEMRDDEARLLEFRQETARRDALFSIAALLVSVFVAILLATLTYAKLREQILEISAARDELATTNEQLRIEAINREAADARVRQMQKMEAVGQLTGGIAHDFNNMLAIVIGSLDMALRRLGKGEYTPAAAAVDNAMEGAQRASQLTARLMAFSRQQPLEPQTIDPNKLVAGMSELLRRTLGDHIQIETVLAGGIWKTFADPPQLENALLNLCVNARDAMPSGGKLTIETANAYLDDQYATQRDEVDPGQYVMICVSDMGTGMTPAVIERAFDPFYTTKNAGHGTGLGLSQVFGFIKQSRGHVKIYSEVDEGTIVKIYLPRKFRAGSESPIDRSLDSSAGDVLPRSNEREVVLVVEDEDRVRQVSVEALVELGYDVLEAASAEQALTLLKERDDVTLLFTDVVMPRMNGRELVELVSAQRPAMKVLYTTGYTRNAIVHNGMLDPGVAFLAKPFTLRQLATKVRQVLDKP
jgi:signal transduction histidine kinase